MSKNFYKWILVAGLFIVASMALMGIHVAVLMDSALREIGVSGVRYTDTLRQDLPATVFLEMGLCLRRTVLGDMSLVVSKLCGVLAFLILGCCWLMVVFGIGRDEKVKGSPVQRSEENLP